MEMEKVVGGSCEVTRVDTIRTILGRYERI